jgi:hypothetical protein
MVKFVYMLKKLKRSRNMAIFAGGVVAVGCILLAISMAATSTSSVQPETGTLAGGASVISDAAASGGKYIQFGSKAGTEIFIPTYTTAYTWYDNTPPGSATIAYPTIHSVAGGTGTYADPITMAVGHSIINNKDILDYPAGSKFYIPNVRRYFIVEDSCGDGPTPQNGPCHTGYPTGTQAWIDVWIDGSSGTATQAYDCAGYVTDANGQVHTMIQNPANNYVVVPGPIFQNGKCTLLYGNTAVKQ